MPEEAANLLVNFDKAKQGQETEAFRIQARRKNKAILVLSMKLSSIRDATGEVVGVSKITRDITDQVRLEKQVQDSGTRYRRLFESATEGSCIK